MKVPMVAIACAIASSIAVADTTPAPGGPYQGTNIDARTYLVNKTVDFSVARTLPYRFPYWVSFENVIAGSERLMILMDSRQKPGKNTNLEPAAIRRLTTVYVTPVLPGDIVIDPNDDAVWTEIQPAVSDLAGDSRSSLSGTDLVNVKLARDNSDLYARIALSNGPDAGVMYVFELMQSTLQLNTPGDVLVNCSLQPSPSGPQWRCLIHDRNGAYRNQYGPERVAAGNGFLKWKIPLADLRNQPSPPWAIYPIEPRKLDLGINNRFIRVYTHPNPGQVADEMEPAGQPWNRPLIIDFEE